MKIYRSFLQVLAYSILLVCLVASGLAQTDFPGTNTGAIPDNQCTGAGRSVLFAVSGITGSPTNVRLSMTADHTWVGDVDALLIAPSGAAQHFLFTFVGNDQDPDFGDSSNLGGTYVFFDAATNNFWTAAAGGGTDFVIPGGNYRTSNAFGGNTSMNPVFAGLPSANGTWTLKVNDCAGGDTGSVTAATLTITGATGPPPPDTLGDYDGDGSTDYAVVRNAGGQNGQITWFISDNATSIPRTATWGFASDWFVPADYDGDTRDDIAVWRPGPQSTFFIIQSGSNTLNSIDFGFGSDNPSVVGDYNADGRDDLAVYRPGATPGAQSTFFVSYGGTVYAQPWGLNGDIPAPGDYDGDNRMDFAVQRAEGADGVFYIRYTAQQADTVVTFGLSNDIIVPGYYDADTKTDLAVISESGGFWQWTYRPSAGGPDVIDLWGIAATDYPVPGDYNGDGMNDYAVWRPGPTPGSQSAFHTMRPITHHIDTRLWGLSEDVPVNFTFAHF